MRAELLAYRANPSDLRFNRLYRAAHPWLISTGISTVRRYSNLSVSGALDDVVNEGALALSTSARRFVHFCGDCGRVFVHGRDLSLHAMSDHRRRGAAGAVTLDTFARTSARLVMKRTARRLYRPETLTEWIEDVPSDVDEEERVVLEIMISRLQERVSARARASLELLLRAVVLGDVEKFISVMSQATTRRKERIMEYSPEPNWPALNIRTLRESAKAVLGVDASKRTMKAAYAEVYKQLKASGRELDYTCQNCESLIDDQMERCWACGLVFNDRPDAEEEEVVDAELVARAKKFGIETDGLSRDDLLARIEETETKTRAARRNVDFLTLESQKLNEKVTEAMPDGWTKNISKQYTAYFDPGMNRRVAVFNRGLKVHFSVEDGFLDGFPDLNFFTKEQRRAKHFGRTNYEYAGDTAKYALDLCLRVMCQYGGGS